MLLSSVAPTRSFGALREPRVLQYDEHPTVLRGTPQVLTALAEMDDLRRRTGQQHDLSTDLLLILSRHNAHHRRPVVVLLHADGELRAAVIFSERCVFGVGLGLLRAGDQAGDSAVITFAAERKAALLAGMAVLLRQWRCHTVAASLSGIGPGASDVPAPRGMVAEGACRPVRRYLPLSATFEATLRDRFTLKKRKNLLYYRRTLAKTHAIEFVPRLAPADIEPALLELSQHSWPARTPAEIADHAKFLRRHPAAFCMGLRLANGPWLSLITGWRAGGITHMPWQLNHDDYKDASLMQVMRTYLLEHECVLGQTALSWVGGTVAFQTACEPEWCVDLLQSRRSLRGSLLRHVVAPLMFRRDPDGFIGGSLMLLLPPRSRGLTYTDA